MLWRAEYPLVLASGSAARRALLAAAGLPFEAVPADIDERAAISEEVEQFVEVAQREAARGSSRTPRTPRCRAVCSSSRRSSPTHAQRRADRGGGGLGPIVSLIPFADEAEAFFITETTRRIRLGSGHVVDDIDGDPDGARHQGRHGVDEHVARDRPRHAFQQTQAAIDTRTASRRCATTRGSKRCGSSTSGRRATRHDEDLTITDDAERRHAGLPRSARSRKA